MHVISAWSQQVRRTQEKKEEFWEKMNDRIGKILVNEMLVIGHVERDRNDFAEVMEIDGYRGEMQMAKMKYVKPDNWRF